MEKEQKSIKIKIISLAISIIVCVLLVGVSVWAALQQTLDITNNISITTSGQTKVAVDVSEYIHTGDTAVSAVPSDSVTDDAENNTAGWHNLVIKTADENTKEQAATPIVFSQSEGMNYYAYKFEFSNESETEGESVYAHITADAVDNTQLTIYYGETWGSLTAVENNVGIDADVTLPAKVDETSGTGTFYIVVASNVALGELTEIADPIQFNIHVLLDQVA